jgi:hypothetical protein
MKYVLLGFLILVIVVALGSIIGIYFNIIDLKSSQYFSPRREQVRHDTFECSASHSDGIVRELRQIRDQYNHEDDAGKAALADTFRHEADGYTCYALPPDLQSFSNSVR